MGTKCLTISGIQLPGSRVVWLMPIEVEDAPGPKPGKCLVISMIGPTMDLFEIYQVTEEFERSVTYTHYVNHILVPVEVYRDCLQTSDKDRWCPACAEGECDEHADPDVLS